MKWRWLFILFILVFLSGCENPQLHLHNVFKSIDLEVRSHSQAYPLLLEICDRYGPRMAGTESAAYAEELTALLFRSYGFDNVFFQPFTFNQWLREDVRLKIDTAGTYVDFPALALAYTPSSDIQAPIIDAGNGLVVIGHRGIDHILHQEFIQYFFEFAVIRIAADILIQAGE